jgi:hypothetical protein
VLACICFPALRDEKRFENVHRIVKRKRMLASAPERSLQRQRLWKRIKIPRNRLGLARLEPSATL